jgi:hypothetical protein
VNELDLSDLWLLEVVVELRLPICVLGHPELELALNRAHHGLADTEVAGRLHRLWLGGWIGLDAALTEAEILAQIARRRAGTHSGPQPPSYGLTAAGGAAWEARAHPVWDRYVRHELDFDDGGELHEIEAAGAEQLAAYLAAVGLDGIGVPIAPWPATYWKTLARGVRLEVQTPLTEDRPVVECSWYTRLAR